MNASMNCERPRKCCSLIFSCLLLLFRLLLLLHELLIFFILFFFCLFEHGANIVFLFLKHFFPDGGDVETFLLEELKTLQLLSNIFFEVVEWRVERASERGAREQLEQPRWPEYFLNHSVSFFFKVKVLLVAIHVTSLENSDHYTWISDLIQDTFPCSEDEGTPDSRPHTVQKHGVESHDAIRGDEWTTDEHVEDDELEAAPFLIILQIFFELIWLLEFPIF